MSHSAEALADTSRRNITIEITNTTTNFCLIDPKIYYESGHCSVPPQPVVSPGDVELCNFTKSSGTGSGTVGVLTYNIWKRGNQKMTEKLAIMFSVPYSKAGYDNWFGLGIFSEDTETNEKLYKKMYYDKEQVDFVRAKSNGSAIIFKGRDLDLMATASSMGKCIMKFELWEKLFNPSQSQGPY
ncbi:DELTA-actitoxin-Aeq1c-like [Cheilinus undulatus]|uniref:DELTA-actitoxin-Aeq1c-like n=1 Tax=Cheilinus undulatus TaxID=241271 RepID=UPI001BD3A8B8|nr:DELTA-actitoxin-Aeq1c-like [Cheilinus undulatus]